MKIVLKSLIFLLVILMSWTITIAQTSEQDFDNIRKVYANMAEYTMDLEYKMYKNYTSTIPVDHINMLLKKKGNQCYNRLAGSETLINDKYVMVLNHESKIFMIDKNVRSYPVKGISKTDPDVDKLFSAIMKEIKDEDSIHVTVKEKKISGKEKQYTIYYSGGEYSAVSFSYDVNTYLVKKVILYFRRKMEINTGDAAQAPRLEIVYRQTDLRPGFDKNTFSETAYAVVHKDGSIKLNPAFKDYKMINHLVDQ